MNNQNSNEITINLLFYFLFENDENSNIQKEIIIKTFKIALTTLGAKTHAQEGVRESNLARPARTNSIQNSMRGAASAHK